MCNFIRKALRFALFRFFMFPVLLLMSPLFFLMGKGTCKQARGEVAGVLRDVWDDANN